VAYHELHAVVNQSVGNGNGLLGVAYVVVFNSYQVFTHNTAGGVNAFDGHARARKLHVAVLRNRACHGAGNAYFNLCYGGACAQQGSGCGDGCYELFNVTFHY
jgi:hypothetical protein